MGKLSAAIIGAIATIILTPFLSGLGPIVGGFIAGLVAKEGVGGGAAAGFLSGIIAVAPLAFIVPMAGGIAAPHMLPIFAGVGLAVLVVAGVILGILGAIGGLIGGAIAGSRSSG